MRSRFTTSGLCSIHLRSTQPKGPTHQQQVQEIYRSIKRQWIQVSVQNAYKEIYLHLMYQGAPLCAHLIQRLRARGGDSTQGKVPTFHVHPRIPTPISRQHMCQYAPTQQRYFRERTIPTIQRELSPGNTKFQFQQKTKARYFLQYLSEPRFGLFHQ